MMQYGHVNTAFCIIIKLKVMFWKLYTRIDFKVGTFKMVEIVGSYMVAMPKLGENLVFAE